MSRFKKILRKEWKLFLFSVSRFKKILRKEWKLFLRKIHTTAINFDNTFYSRDGLLIAVASVVSSVTAISLTDSFNSTSVYSLVWNGLKTTFWILIVTVSMVWILFAVIDLLVLLIRVIVPKRKKKKQP